MYLVGLIDLASFVSRHLHGYGDYYRFYKLASGTKTI
jgi:hypothetical protein